MNKKIKKLVIDSFGYCNYKVEDSVLIFKEEKRDGFGTTFYYELKIDIKRKRVAHQSISEIHSHADGYTTWTKGDEIPIDFVIKLNEILEEENE